MSAHLCECCGQRLPLTPKAKAAQIVEARARNAAGESASVLAKVFGVSIPTVREWCAGARTAHLLRIRHVDASASPGNTNGIISQGRGSRSPLEMAWGGA